MNILPFLLLPLLLLPAACKNKQPVSGPPGTTLTWEKIAQDGNSGVEAESYQLINDPESWAALWNQLNSTRFPAPVAPEIDFDRYSVVVCMMGTRVSGGFSVSIRRLEQKGNELLLTVEHAGPGRGCFVTEALTQPYYLASIPQTTASLSVSKEVRQVDCE